MKSKNFSRFLKPSQFNFEFIERFFVSLLAFIFLCLSFFFYEKQKTIKLSIHGYLSPLYSFLAIPNNYFNLFLDSFNNYVNLKATNKKLLQKLDQSRENLSELYHLKVENEELKKLLNVKAPPSSKVIVSRIILDISDIFSSRVFIDVGSEQGLRLNVPVFNENGFLGRVIDVSENLSEVLLINDPRSKLPVISETSKIKFFVEGNFENLKIKHKNNEKDFVDGELVISTSASGYFKKGIVVGKIKKIKKRIRVIPNAKINDSVYVMTLAYEYTREYPNID